MELYYLKLGSTPLFDSLFTYFNGSIAVLATMLNLASFIVFKKIKLYKKAFHQYLKCYTLFCTLICLIAIFNNIFTAPRFINLKTSLFSFYKCKITYWFTATINFYLNSLDCILLFERISCLTNKRMIKKFFEINSYLICLILFIVCNLINLTSYFFFSSRNESEYEMAIQNIKVLNNFTYCFREPFFQDWPGRAIPIVIVVFRDGFILIAQIVLSLCSIIMFRRYLKEQMIELNSINELNSSQILNQLEEYNDNLTKMTLYLSLCSIMCNLIIGSGFIMVSFNFSENTSMRLIIFMANLIGLIKHSSNFFLFFHFNRYFRDFFKIK
jgi:hypothetical protein